MTNRHIDHATLSLAIVCILCTKLVGWFTKASERQRIDSVINRARRLGYCSPDTPTFNDLCNDADDELFNKATLWSNHVLHALLPPTSVSSQRYNLRQRPHLLQLPEHMTQLYDCSFLIRICCTKILTDFSFFFFFYPISLCHALLNDD